MDDLLRKLKAIADGPSPFDLEGPRPKPGPIVEAPDPTWASVFGFELPRDEEIAFLIIIEGLSRNGISKRLGISYGTVKRAVEKPSFKQAFHALQATFRSETFGERKGRLENLSTHALDRLSNIIYNSADEDLVAKTSIAVIDRTGHATKQKIEHDLTVHIDKEAGECIEAAFREVGIKALEYKG